MTTVVLDSAGEDAIIQEGESFNLVVTFYDLAGAAISKDSLISLRCTYYDRDSLAIINGRNAQNVLDANNGLVSEEGVLTLRLGPADTAIIGDIAPSRSQTKAFLFTWTWTDSIAVRTGKCGPLMIRIENLAEPT